LKKVYYFLGKPMKGKREYINDTCIAYAGHMEYHKQQAGKVWSKLLESMSKGRGAVKFYSDIISKIF